MVPEAKLPPVILMFPLLIYPEDVLATASLLEATANPFPVVDFISLPVLIVTISFDKPTLWNAIFESSKFIFVSILNVPLR